MSLLSIIQNIFSTQSDAENRNATWAKKVRRYLALDEPELLNEAIAEAQGQPEIVTFLQAFSHRNIMEVTRLANQMIPKLNQTNRREESLTIHLLCLHLGAELAEHYIYYEFGRQKETREFAIGSCQQAIETSQTLNDKPCQAKYLFLLGNGFRNSQQHREAERFYTEAVRLYRDLGLQEPLAKTLINLGIVQSDLRKFIDAEKSYGEALPIYRELASHKPDIFNQNVAKTLNNLGSLQIALKNFPDAEKFLAEALKINRILAEKDPDIFNHSVAKTLINLGSMQGDMQKFIDAEKSYFEALQLYRWLALREPYVFERSVGMALNNLGVVQEYLQKLTDAEYCYDEALKIRRSLALREPDIFNQEVAETLNNLGSLKLLQDKLNEAKEYFESARDLIEDLRAKAITIDDRQRILLENVRIYNNLLTCYIKMKDWQKALEIAELGKSRSLSDLLNLKSEDLQPKSPNADTLAIVKDLGQKYSDAIKELQRLESYEKYLSEQLNRFDNDIKRIEDDNDNDDHTRQGFLRQIAEQKQSLGEEKRKVQDIRFATQSHLKNVLQEINKYDQDFPPKAKAINPESIFEISRNLNRTIVMFRILHESTAIIFVFPTGELHIEEIKGFGEKEMFELFRDKWLIPYEQLRNKAVGGDVWQNAIEQTLEIIYEKLIFRVHQILWGKSDCKEVLFVPNRSLALLPLHAASWREADGKKHYLLEEFTISYAPSVSVFKRCQENEKQRSNKTLFLTNPNGCDTEKHEKSFACAEFLKYGRYKSHLYFSEEEVSFIEKLHTPSRNLLGKDATKSAVIEALRDDYGFTHFSCHGFYHQQNPFDSGLEMSDEVIKLSEIINSNLENNWLTTLSACETGMVDFQSPTDEHFGLPLGFIFAGSPSVWASLWSVSDMATAELMKTAYENLSKEEYKNNKPEALRQAQLSMLNDDDLSHPYFWAGFQHFGV